LLPRKGHATVVHNGKVWILGGYTDPSTLNLDAPVSAQVWSSSDGFSWNLKDAIAPVGPMKFSWGNIYSNEQRGFLDAISFQNKLWVIGGPTSSVWYMQEP
jgi:hypothetical protein